MLILLFFKIITVIIPTITVKGGNVEKLVVLVDVSDKVEKEISSLVLGDLVIGILISKVSPLIQRI